LLKHAPEQKYVVTPLELFFDLVFAFALSQLSQHLATHLFWRSAAETVVMLPGLFMKASVTLAFTSGRAFVFPLLMIQLGRTTQAAPPYVALLLVGASVSALAIFYL
jgi:low temperature requirement protein LtrA